MLDWGLAMPCLGSTATAKARAAEPAMVTTMVAEKALRLGGVAFLGRVVVGEAQVLSAAGVVAAGCLQRPGWRAS